MAFLNTTLTNDTQEETIPSGYLLEPKIQAVKQKPLFPLHVFPKSIQELASKAVAARKFAPDYFGAGILFAASTAIGNSLRTGIEVGRAMPCSLYLVIVGESGANKSEPLKIAISPINDYDSMLNKEYQRRLIEYKNRAKGEKISQPHLESVISTDITYETILRRLKNSPKAFSIVYDELKLLFGNTRYNGTDIEPFLLEAWNGGTYKKDRSSDESTVMLKNVFLNIIGGIQKQGVQRFFTADRIDSGFTQRCLFLNPDTKPQAWSQEKIDYNQLAAYKSTIQKLIELSYNPYEPIRFIPLSNTAEKAVRAWQADSVKKRMQDISHFEKSMLAKMDYYVLRLPLILQALFYATGEDTLDSISEKAVLGAIELVEYFSYHALSVFDLIDNQSPLDAMAVYKKHFYEALPDTFQRKEILNLANKYGVKKTTLSRMLTDTELFRASSYGNYEKLF